MKIHLLIFSIFIFGSQLAHALEPPNVELLKKELAKFDLQNPAAEAQRNSALCKTRFIGVYGYAVEYPSISDWDELFLVKFGSEVIKGTSDAIEGQEHDDLITKARKYAEAYNKTLLKIYKNQENRGENPCPPGDWKVSTVQIKKTADQEAIRLGYEIKKMKVSIYSVYSSDPSMGTELKGKGYIVIGYAPIPSANFVMMGGNLQIVFDPKSGKVIRTLAGQ